MDQELLDQCRKLYCDQFKGKTYAEIMLKLHPDKLGRELTETEKDTFSALAECRKEKKWKRCEDLPKGASTTTSEPSKEFKHLEPVRVYLRTLVPSTISVGNVLATESALDWLFQEKRRLQHLAHSGFRDDFNRFFDELGAFYRVHDPSIKILLHELEGIIEKGCAGIENQIKLRDLKAAQRNFDLFTTKLGSIILMNENQPVMAHFRHRFILVREYATCRTKLREGLDRLAQEDAKQQPAPPRPPRPYPFEPVVAYFQNLKTIDYNNVLAVHMAHLWLNHKRTEMQNTLDAQYSHWSSEMKLSFNNQLQKFDLDREQINHKHAYSMNEALNGLTRLTKNVNICGPELTPGDLEVAQSNLKSFTEEMRRIIALNEQQPVMQMLYPRRSVSQHSIVIAYEQCRTKLMEGIARLLHMQQQATESKQKKEPTTTNQRKRSRSRSTKNQKKAPSRSRKRSASKKRKTRG